MKYSQLFAKTRKTAPSDADSINARLLQKGGFIDQLMAGVYTFLPLGNRIHEKIKNIIREEMNAIGGQELLMPALTPKELWVKTKRWDEIDVLFKLEGRGGKEYALGSTHEEVITPLAKHFINSYKDLPLAVYQIQNKYRDEPRAKSGLLRGREFSMKDLYSFHASEEDLEDYYGDVMQAYLKIFERCGLKSYVVEASGGVFSKYSHEFQVPTEYGEDLFYACHSCDHHQNREIAEGLECPDCGKKRESLKSIEVGNIFKLGTRFSEAFDLIYTAEDGSRHLVIMGCYGIGPSRVMGTIAEVHHDETGILWPEETAPYQVHLIEAKSKLLEVKKEAEKLYESLRKKNIEVLYDDREEASMGEKLADADLIGCPVRLVVSEKSLGKGGIEVKRRSETDVEIIDAKDIIKKI